MTLYRPREAVFAGEMAVPLSPEDIYAADHPLVKQYPTLFVEVQVHSAKSDAPVEAATAAPGEKRQTRPPK